VNSSIFSSRLVRASVACVCMLAAYNVWLLVSPPSITHFHNQWVKNRAKAENYIYQVSSADVVIVGSSMAARLLPEEVAANATNLAFASSGPVSGVEIIMRSDRAPELLLIESNTLEKEADSDMLDALFTPILWQTKKYLRFLQFHYQPSNILLSVVMGKFANSAEEKRQKPPSKEVLQRETQRQVKIAQDSAVLEKADFSALQHSLDQLRKSGTKVIFFTMPVAPEVMQTSRYRVLQNRITTEFEAYPYWQLSVDEVAKYQTNDGVHLNALGALKFSQQLGDLVSSAR